MFKALEILEIEMENLKIKLKGCVSEEEKDKLLESYSALYEKINSGYMLLEGSHTRRIAREK